MDGRPEDQVPGLIRALYDVVAQLEGLFTGRRFTLDGHLVGSIGEVYAAHRYALTLLPASTMGRDAIAPDGRDVEIKATQGTSIGLRHEPRHLLVLRLTREGEAIEVYNGPGAPVWQAAGAMQRNGQRSVSLSRLRALMQDVSESERLPARPQQDRVVAPIDAPGRAVDPNGGPHPRPRVASSGLFIYAKDLPRMAAFYETVLDLAPAHPSPDLVMLRAPGIELLLHAIPPHIAADIDISVPPVAREDAALKFFFTVPSLAAAAGIAARHGGEVLAARWQGPGFSVRNAVDPEGNIFQLREASP
jgi:predicted enzyme related to lactoylglutathione lyase